MKKTITLFFLAFGLLSGIYGNAQNVYGSVLGTNFTYQPINNTEHHFIFQTFFSFGSSDCDATYVGNQITIEGDTLYVKAFYDIHGIWATFGCSTTSTVVYNVAIPTSIRYIKMATYVIATADAPPYDNITVPDVYLRIIDLSLSVLDMQNATVSVAPNPTAGIINIADTFRFEQAIVINNLGQIVTDFKKAVSNSYDIQNLKSGLYYVQFYDIDHKNIGVTKIIKQ
jgi:hypothetical protein